MRLVLTNGHTNIMPSKKPAITIFTAIKLQGCGESSSKVSLMATSVTWPQIFLLLLFVALYGSTGFYFSKDVKTFITVQGQRGKDCIETETTHVATGDGINLEVRVHITNVYVDVISGGVYRWQPRRDEPADLKGVTRSTCVQGQGGERNS